LNGRTNEQSHPSVLTLAKRKLVKLASRPKRRLESMIGARTKGRARAAESKRLMKYLDPPESLKKHRNVVYIWSALLVTLKSGGIEKSSVVGPGVTLTLRDSNLVRTSSWIVMALLGTDYLLHGYSVVVRLRHQSRTEIVDDSDAGDDLYPLERLYVMTRFIFLSYLIVPTSICLYAILV
jgi:hypothetical protein